MFGAPITQTAIGYGTDCQVPAPPTDGVSSVALTDLPGPSSALLASSSWDKTVRVWSVASDQTSTWGDKKLAATSTGMITERRPVLSTCFRPSDNAVFFGGLSSEVKLWQPAGVVPATVVATHEKPVIAVRWLENHGGLVVSGSWDGTVKLSDPRAAPGAPGAGLVVNVGAKVLAMDVRGGVLAVATTDRAVKAYNVENFAAGQPPPLIDSSAGTLEHQYSSIAVFSDCSGYAVGGIEGRTTIKYFKEEGSSKTFTFKCHRKTITNGEKFIEAYPVNDIAFHPLGTFATCGGDGSFCFWDYKAKSRLKNCEKCTPMVSSCAFNQRGDVFAYATSYDWFQGPKDVPSPHGIFLHSVKEAEIRPKK